MTNWKKPVAGEPFRPSASMFGAFIDAARAHRENNRGGAGPGINTNDSNRILIRNDTGATIEQFSVLAIGDAAIPPTGADEVSFRSSPIFAGDTPSGTGGNFCIVQVPLADGETGIAIAAGCSWVQIDVTNENHNYADATSGDESQLTSADSGAARILYKESGIGTKWAFVRIDESDGSSANGTVSGPCGCSGIEVGSVDCLDTNDSPEVFVVTGLTAFLSALGIAGVPDEIELVFDANCTWISDTFSRDCGYGA